VDAGKPRYDNGRKNMFDGPSFRRDLSSIACLKTVSRSTLDEMEKRCRWHELARGDRVFSEGDPLERIFFVLRGELRIIYYTSAGKVVSLRSNAEGNFVGEMAVSSNTPAPYTVEATGPAVVASMNVRHFSNFVERDRELLQMVIVTLAARQQLLCEQLIEIATQSVPARVRAELLRLCDGTVAKDGSAVISPFPTSSELARRIGTQREAVSRELGDLQRAGLIARDLKGLVVHNVFRLGNAPLRHS